MSAGRHGALVEQSGRKLPRITANTAGSKARDFLQPAACSCIRLPRTRDGKEGVDGSSPSEGSAKVQHVAAFAFSPTCRVGSVRWVWSRLWSFRVQNGVARRRMADQRG